MQYVELAFTVAVEESESAAGKLVEAGASGVEERDATTFARAPEGRAALVVWIPPGEVEVFLARARAAGLGGEVARRDRDEDEWRDAWKRHFTARIVGRFVIVPSWEKYAAAPDELVLDLDPGRAFGTGGHASTRLCLLALSREMRAPKNFLDVGCGSGVLAIAAARRFSDARGAGIDIDPDAIDVSRENAARNRVAGRIDFSTTIINEVQGEYDLITANIQPEILIPMAPAIAARLAPGGRLILSGILIEAAPPVDEAYRALGLVPSPAIDEEGWRALEFSRRG